MARGLAFSAALPFLALAGCAASGSGFTLFPMPHRLSAAAENLRAAQPQAIAAPRELQKSVATELRVEPGDVLGFGLAEPEDGIELPADQPILADGTVDLGGFGRIMVAYRTLAELERMVGDSLTTQLHAKARETHALTEAERLKKDPKAKPAPLPPDRPPVRVVARFAPRPSSKVVYVFGEVASPGAFNLEGRETVLDALVAAGGLTRAADHAGIVLTRPSAPCDPRTVLPICYDNIVQLGDTSTNYQALPGDRIFVPSLTLCERLFKKRRRPNCPPCVELHTARRLPTLECNVGSACPPVAAPFPALVVALPPLETAPLPPATPGTPKPPADEPKKTRADEPKKAADEPKTGEPKKLPEPKAKAEAPRNAFEPLPMPPRLPATPLPAAAGALRTPRGEESPVVPAVLEIRPLPAAPAVARTPSKLEDSAYRIDYGSRR